MLGVIEFILAEQIQKKKKERKTTQVDWMSTGHRLTVLQLQTHVDIIHKQKCAHTM